LAIGTQKVLAALARLTGDKGKQRRHNTLFRKAVTSADGQRCSVNVSINHHRREASSAALNDIADRLRIDRSQVLNVLESWTPEQLEKHLQTLSADELKPPAFRG
jgi:hypothetical protein